jgi:hypothetical protein
VALGAGCESQEDTFVGRRVEDLCAGSVPVCEVRAACVLDETEYARGEFPGAQRFVVRSEYDEERLVVRLLFSEQVYPGTELLVQLYAPACASVETEHFVDVDLFALAGEDRILELSFPMGSRGDHLLEVFSDMSAAWLLTTELELE